MAVAAYNAGPGNVNKWVAANGDPRLAGVDVIEWIEKIPIYETRNYVQRVLENAVIYDVLNPAKASMRAGVRRLSAYLGRARGATASRSEEHTSELQSLMRISYAVFCLKKKKTDNIPPYPQLHTYSTHKHH